MMLATGWSLKTGKRHQLHCYWKRRDPVSADRVRSSTIAHITRSVVNRMRSVTYLRNQSLNRPVRRPIRGEPRLAGAGRVTPGPDPRSPYWRHDRTCPSCRPSAAVRGASSTRCRAPRCRCSQGIQPQSGEEGLDGEQCVNSSRMLWGNPRASHAEQWNDHGVSGARGPPVPTVGAAQFAELRHRVVADDGFRFSAGAPIPDEVGCKHPRGGGRR